MIPCRIQLSGATLLLLICWATLKPLHAAAQTCSGTIQSVTYSTVISGTGSGTYAASLPQYNSSSGYTLISAVLNSYVTTNSTVKFTNTDPSNEADFSPLIGRTDILKLDGTTTLGGASSNFSFPFTSLDPAGGANDNVTYGPQAVFNNTHMVSDSITTASPMLTASFQGTGSVNFTYKSTTSLTSALGVSNTASVSDAITLSVTYYFCNPTVLSSNVITFMATLENNRTASLNWITANEQAGRRYELEMSSNGKDFTTFDTQASDPINTEASYSYQYPIGSGVTGKLYFRLKQIDIDGTASYSQVRIIDLDGTGTAPGFSIYPNPPTDFINLVFPSSTLGWQVDILTADGSLVQRNYYGSIGTGRLNFQRKLAAGTYFARATDLQAAKNYVSPFVIR